jgi:hypothetical protein
MLAPTKEQFYSRPDVTSVMPPCSWLDENVADGNPLGACVVRIEATHVRRFQRDDRVVGSVQKGIENQSSHAAVLLNFIANGPIIDRDANIAERFNGKGVDHQSYPGLS